VKDIEVCAVRLKISPIQLIILAIYRSPSGNFTNFLKNLDSILNTWHTSKVEFVICGDININYLENCNKRQQLDELLQTYNLIGTVSFPTRKSKASTTAIENIFIIRTKNYNINPHINGLSDHETHIITVESMVPAKQTNKITTKSDVDEQSTLEFQLLLSHETWEDIFMENDANTPFNIFLNMYLKMFHCCFIKKHTKCKAISKPWLTKGIQTSCNQKRELYLKMRDNNEMKHKLYYKQY